MGQIAANAVGHGDRARAGRALALVESSHPDHREDYRRARHTRQMAFAEPRRRARPVSCPRRSGSSAAPTRRSRCWPAAPRRRRDDASGNGAYGISRHCYYAWLSRFKSDGQKGSMSGCADRIAVHNATKARGRLEGTPLAAARLLQPGDDRHVPESVPRCHDPPVGGRSEAPRPQSAAGPLGGTGALPPPGAYERKAQSPEIAKAPDRIVRSLSRASWKVSFR